MTAPPAARPVLVLAALGLALLGPVPLAAQGERDFQANDAAPPPDLPPVAGRAPGALGPAVVQALQDATRFCGGIDAAYRIDCLAERLDFITDAMPQGGDFTAARAAIDAGGDRLRDIALADRDAGQPLRSYASGGPRPQKSRRALTAVRAASARRANAAALDAIEATRARIAAGADSSPAIALQLSRIAAAIGSNKVLLRG